MVTHSRLAARVLVVMSLAALTPAADRRFVSPHQFAVMYPRGWWRFGISPDRLQILSSKGGAKGLIIKQGQAYISVKEDSSTMSLSGLIDYYTSDATILSRRTIALQPSNNGCATLTEVISREPALPQEWVSLPVGYITNTNFFCEAEGRKIVTVLRNWEVDRRQEEYQRTALRVAKSITLLQ